ncbi:10088_t:CDS:1, partial [Scutellospora calospora]
PGTPISSLILPPRKKETVQLPLRKTSIITPSSSIITFQHVAEISSWIDRRSTIYDTTELPYEFKLLLRGSMDGFEGETFHRLCDNIPGTVVIVKINKTNEILGGYNPLIWKVSSNWTSYGETADSFVFSLKNGNLNESILSRVSDQSRAIGYGNISEGPSFSFNDLGMTQTNQKIKAWYCIKDSYNKPIRNEGGYFYVDEYEVFQICKNI